MPNELTEKKEGFVSLAEKQDLSEIIKPLTKEIHLFDTYIAGTSYLEKDNVVFARLMDAGKLLIARVARIDTHGDFYQIAIGIYLVDF